MGDAPRSIRKYYAPALGAFSIAPERRKMKLKKKTLYNILMIAAIALGVAVPNILARKKVNAAKRRAFDAQIREQRERGNFIDITKL